MANELNGRKKIFGDLIVARGKISCGGCVHVANGFSLNKKLLECLLRRIFHVMLVLELGFEVKHLRVCRYHQNFSRDISTIPHALLIDNVFNYHHQLSIQRYKSRFIATHMPHNCDSFIERQTFISYWWRQILLTNPFQFRNNQFSADDWWICIFLFASVCAQVMVGIEREESVCKWHLAQQCESSASATPKPCNDNLCELISKRNHATEIAFSPPFFRVFFVEKITR